MAARTFTASELNSLAAVHAGPNVVIANLSVPVASSLTASDVLFLAKLPNHCLVHDIQLAGGIVGITSWVLSAGIGLPTGTAYPVDGLRGLSISANSIAATISLTSSGQSRPGGVGWVQGAVPVPFSVSFSDDIQPQYVWLQATCGGSTTGSMSLQCVVSYQVGLIRP